MKIDTHFFYYPHLTSSHRDFRKLSKTRVYWLSLIMGIILFSFMAYADQPSDVYYNWTNGIPVVINQSYTFNSTGSFRLNAPSASLGAISIGYSGGIMANNIKLNCNGAWLYGNQVGYGLKSINGQNISVENCNFANYTTAVAAQRNSVMDRNFTILNSIVANSTSVNLFISCLNDSLIDNVTTYGSVASHGIYISYDTTATANVGHNDGIIRNSRSYNNGASGLQFNSDGAVNKNILRWRIYNNSFYNNGGNGINDLACNYCNYSNNSIYNNSARAMAFYFNVIGVDNYNTSSKWNIIRNNFIYQNTGNLYWMGNLSYGNQLIDNYYDFNSSFLVRGHSNFSVNESTPLTQLHFFDINGYVTLNYNGRKDFLVNQSTISLSSIGSNYSIYNKTGKTVVYNNVANATWTVGAGESFNIEINCWLFVEAFNLSYGTSLCSEQPIGIQRTNYSYMRINVSTVGYNFTLKNLTDYSPYIQVFNGTSSTAQCEDVRECNVTLPPNNRSIVINYIANEPKLLLLNTTILTLTPIYADNWLRINCEGTGGHTWNMTSFGDYTVYHNNVRIGYYNSINITLDGCSDWDIYDGLNYDTSTPSERHFGNPFLTNGILMLASVLSIIGFIVLIFLSYKQQNFNLLKYAFALLLSMIAMWACAFLIQITSS